ncbi:MAG: leucyl/phenylalanyl-tRNA---protein transferase, partial [Kribbellaceae bacterium]|nr:leucyl/phenylalanyl-tRNA---protein transferase [Kribbellaceae bacterium]
ADRVFDIQWVTDHLATLGATAIPREQYIRRVERALELPLPEAFR